MAGQPPEHSWGPQSSSRDEEQQGQQEQKQRSSKSFMKEQHKEQEQRSSKSLLKEQQLWVFLILLVVGVIIIILWQWHLIRLLISDEYCVILPSPVHGKILQQKRSYKALTSVVCDEGYAYSKPEFIFRECQADGTWSGEEGTCEKVVCPPLDAPLHGKIYQLDRSYKAIAHVMCDEGYIYSKPEFTFRQCLANATWSGEEGICKNIACPTLLAPNHGKIFQSHTTYKALVHIMCDEGYSYSKPESTQRECLADATWSGQEGVCEKVVCPALPTPLHGKVIQSDGRYKATGHITCDEGYAYSKPEFMHRECQADGTWSGEEGICEKVACLTLSSPAHGKIHQLDKSYKALAHIECDEGYIYTKPEYKYRECLADGTWSGEEGTCENIACPPLTVPDHGKIVQSEGSYKGLAHIICDEGYIYTKSEYMYRECLADSTWSGEEGICEKLSCPTLIAPVHGKIHQPDRSYKALAQIICDEGYTYSKREFIFRQCLADATWSGEEGICENVACRMLPSPEHGNIFQSVTSFKALVKITCDEGYAYSQPESSTRECQADGTWSGQDGICEKVICPHLPDLEYRKIHQPDRSYKAIARIKCDEGYTYSAPGEMELECSADGTWSGGEIGICERTVQLKIDNIIATTKWTILCLCCTLFFVACKRGIIT